MPLLPVGKGGIDVADRYRRERAAWDAFYDALASAEAGLSGGAADRSGEARRAAARIVEAARLV